MEAASRQPDIAADLEEAYRQISGNTTELEPGLFLSSLAHEKMALGDVVEIGTNLGMSAIALAYGVRDAAKKVYTVDIYKHHQSDANWRMAGVADQIEALVGPSHVVAKTFHGEIGLLFIDGDHSYRGVVVDIKAWCGKVVKGGYVVFDDYPGHKKSKSSSAYSETNNVGRAVHRLVLSRPYLYRVVVDRDFEGLLVVEKLKSCDGSARRSWRSRWYWIWRDLRAWAVWLFPSLASRYGERFKESRSEGQGSTHSQ